MPVRSTILNSAHVIDIVFLLVLAYAIFKGWQQGFIVAVASALALLVGLAAALKLSTAVAAWLGTTFHAGGRWLPFLAFLLVMVGVAFLVRRLAGLLESTAETLFLGWANKLLGIVLYAYIFTAVLSIVLFYLNQLSMLSAEAKTASLAWPVLEPLGPKSIALLGELIPWFKNMFSQLQQFFQGLAPKPSTTSFMQPIVQNPYFAD